MAKSTSKSGSRKPKPEVAPMDVAPAAANRRPGIEDVNISAAERVALYAAAAYLPASFQKKAGLQLPFVTYFQDPFVAKGDPTKAFDEEVFVDWEPGLADGPTSARFAVVDYNADTGKLAGPAEWDDALGKFVSAGKALDAESVATFQFHQVSVWALLQKALAFFESGNGLGRRIPWAFEGNRLIVVPHAGYGENAYYDRSSKSLQFYYFGSDEDTVYTCLSSDIVNHEFAHAVLDGIRPYFNESSSVQTAAFHEFTGDLSAILLTLRNNVLRKALANATGGKIEDATTLSSIAEEFGKAVLGKPYLRSAGNKFTMSDMATETEPHHVSEVLTGAMFDVLIKLAEKYQKEDPDDADTEGVPKKRTPAQAFYRASERMQRVAVQPYDLLPPVEVTFRDYALAVCRAEQLSDPIDPKGYHAMLLDVFLKRGILSKDDVAELSKVDYLFDRLQLSVAHQMSDISRSRASAYRFLDDNREALLIPANRDFFVADLYDANKLDRQRNRLPRQIILEYVWREDVLLTGSQFGQYEGRTTTLLCGGTLVFNDNGNVLSWAMKPGSLPYGGKRERKGALQKQWDAAVQEGVARRETMLANLVVQIAAGRIGDAVGSANGLLGAHMPPMTAEGDDKNVQFRLSPHLHLSEHDHIHEQEENGGRQWEISC